MDTITKSHYRHLFVFLSFFLLLGCQNSYQSEHLVDINIEVASLTEQIDQLNEPTLNSLIFTKYDNSTIDFSNNKNGFIFKITHQEAQDSDHSLLVSPHYLNHVVYMDETLHLKDRYTRNAFTAFHNYSTNFIAFDDIGNASYVHIKTNLAKPVNFSIESQKKLRTYDQNLLMLFTSIYAIILTLVFTHIVFYFFIKKASYLYYSVYIFGILFSLLFQEGMIGNFPALSYPVFGDYTKLIWLKIPSAFYWLFILEFLDIKSRSKFDYKLVKVLLYSEVALIGFMLMLSIFKISGVYAYLSLAVNLQFIVGIIVAIYVPVKYALKGLRHAQYLAIGVTAHMITAIMRIKYTVTLEPLAFWMPRAFEFGLLFEALLLSLGLSDKTMRVIKEKDIAETKVEHADRALFYKELENNFQQKSMNSIDKNHGSQAQLNNLINIYFASALRQLVEVEDVFYVSESGNKIKPQLISGKSSNFDIDNYIDNNAELMNSICTNHVASFQSNEYKTDSDLPFVIIPIKEKVHENMCLFLTFPSYVEIKSNTIDDLYMFANMMSSSLFTVKKYQQTVNETRFDNLTQVFNRKTILEKLDFLTEEAKTSNNAVAVAFIDVDNFKQINDDYGHDLGDKMLVFLCQQLKERFNNNAYVGRYGGDEFIVVFDNYNKAQIESVLDDLYSYFNANKLGEVSLEASIGVAMNTNTNTTRGKELLKRADQALYLAKEKGKNQYMIM